MCAPWLTLSCSIDILVTSCLEQIYLDEYEVKMSSLHTNIKQIINRVLSEDREPLKDILDHKNTEDVVHAAHFVMDGGEKGGPEAENLIMPIDHAAAVGGDPVVRSIEVLDHSTGDVVPVTDRNALGMTESQLRVSIRNILLKVL